LWLNAGAPPAQIAARAGHSVIVLLTVYTHCIDGQDQITNRLIEHALRSASMALCPKASGSANRYHHSDPVRYMSVDWPARPGMAHNRLGVHARTTSSGCPRPLTVCPAQKRYLALAPTDRVPLDLAHVWPTEHSRRSA
jgi:hypothetical protein